MNNQIGISFSEKFLHITYVKDDGVTDTISAPYPFSFRYDILFRPENLTALSDLLKSKIDELQIVDPSLSIVLPMNFVHTKRIAIPQDTGRDLLQTQVEWEFNNFLSEPVESFKIVNTQIEYVFDTYKEVLFVAISKSVLSSLEELSQLCQATLGRVVPLTFLIEEILPPEKQGANCLVVKIEKSQINSLLYVSGKYYHSYFDRAQNSEENQAESLFEASKKRIQEIHSTLDQLPFVESKELQCYIYGDGLTDDLERLYGENLSEPVTRLSIAESDQSHSGIEAVKVLQN